jgi:hypothetical protein
LSRQYRVWDYTPSHEQLLVRAVADSSHSENHDLIFAGVSFMSLPETLVDATVRPASSEDLNEFALRDQVRAALNQKHGQKVYLLEGTSHSGLGVVVARSFHEESNSSDLLDSSLRHPIELFETPREFEHMVVAELARIAGADMEIGGLASGVDALIRRPGKTIAVEIKYFEGAPVLTVVRRTVMQLVGAMSKLPKDAGVLLVTNEADPRLADELRKHLITALSRPQVGVEAVAWRGQRDNQSLRTAIEALTGAAA